MGTIADKLLYLQDTKSAIKEEYKRKCLEVKSKYPKELA